MAQNFRRFVKNNVGTAAETVFTADSYDAVVGISLANVHTAAITVSAYITSGGNDLYLVKDAPLPIGSSLQVLDGGAKLVVENTDVLKVQSDTASSLDAYVSCVDSIST